MLLNVSAVQTEDTVACGLTTNPPAVICNLFGTVRSCEHKMLFYPNKVNAVYGHICDQSIEATELIIPPLLDD